MTSLTSVGRNSSSAEFNSVLEILGSVSVGALLQKTSPNAGVVFED